MLMLDRLIVSLAVLVVAVISNCACLHVVVVEHRISVKSLNACGHGKKKKTFKITLELIRIIIFFFFKQ